MKIILSTNKKEILVDDEDYEKFNKHNWWAHKSGIYNIWYAQTHIRVNHKDKVITMHNMIMSVPKGMHTDHIDHNGLNNQKSNLRICTNSENQKNRIYINPRYIHKNKH
jgi:hypothetical protein